MCSSNVRYMVGKHRYNVKSDTVQDVNSNLFTFYILKSTNVKETRYVYDGGVHSVIVCENVMEKTGFLTSRNLLVSWDY